MSLFQPAERQFAEAVSRMSFANPFLRERVELEREALGNDFDSSTRPFWSWTLDDEADRPNVVLLAQRISDLAEQTRSRIESGVAVPDDEWKLYDDIVHYQIYYSTIAYGSDRNSEPELIAEQWNEFSESFDHWMRIGDRQAPSYSNKPHVFSYLSQLRDAFFHIFHFVLGRSWPIAQLRARIWQSIFTHNMRRYRRMLYQNMQEIATLVTGPSGTGKELVARAVGLSQYRAFNPRTKKFAGTPDKLFVPVNLSAFSPTLIESELFGHQKGAFTGAHDQRVGYLESVEPQGCLFLDEIGELDMTIQVKLLRVLQTRQFQRIGETKSRPFAGKIISATNRDLMREIESERFREDFYYRLCSDVIETPSLVEQLDDRPDELAFLIKLITNRIGFGDDASLADDVIRWCRENLPRNYHWPGNMRELEQCIRNVLIHNDYLPRTGRTSQNSAASIANELQSMSLTAEQLIGRYCELVYSKIGSYEKAAKILNLDRRTVKAKIDAVTKENV